jgi:hypothetical protein
MNVIQPPAPPNLPSIKLQFVLSEKIVTGICNYLIYHLTWPKILMIQDSLGSTTILTCVLARLLADVCDRKIKVSVFKLCLKNMM